MHMYSRKNKYAFCNEKIRTHIEAHNNFSRKNEYALWIENWNKN